MEIPPPSSAAQISAYFTGYSDEEKQKMFFSLSPMTAPFKPIESLDIVPASTSSGESTDFKEKDFKYAWQMYTGQLMYPFDNIAQVTHHQYDPSYFDGSEERNDSFNVQENLIGFPLDSPQLVDPRVAYIDSLMKMKEYTAGNIPLDSSYLNTLFMSTTEKGANYYANQLNDLNEAMGQYARKGYAIKNSVNIPEDYYRRHVGRGVPSHEIKTKTSHFMEQYSVTPTVQSNHRREEMRKAETINSAMTFQLEPKTEKNGKRKADAMSNLVITDDRPDGWGGGSSMQKVDWNKKISKTATVATAATLGMLGGLIADAATPDFLDFVGQGVNVASKIV
jgi:hypothetical protein